MRRLRAGGSIAAAAAAAAVVLLVAAAGRGPAYASYARAGEPTSTNGAAPELGGGFELSRARAKPGLAFFDAKRQPELRFRFRAEAPLDLRVEIVRGRDGNPVRRWILPAARPGERQEQSWNGLNERGRPMPDGRYSFRVGPAGERSRLADTIELHGHRFPIPGPHRYREGEGEFGAPRPGRVHLGKDVWASCGSRLVAARGGRVARRGYDPALNGHFLLIDARGTSADHLYVHLAAPSPAHEGERVDTGERIGSVGRSGNAQSVGCMLHLEIWPHGYRDGNPTDPEPHLRAWDRWS